MHRPPTQSDIGMPAKSSRDRLNSVSGMPDNTMQGGPKSPANGNGSASSRYRRNGISGASEISMYGSSRSLAKGAGSIRSSRREATPIVYTRLIDSQSMVDTPMIPPSKISGHLGGVLGPHSWSSCEITSTRSMISSVPAPTPKSAKPPTSQSFSGMEFSQSSNETTKSKEVGLIDLHLLIC